MGIALVARHFTTAAWTPERPDRLEQVHRAHHVRGDRSRPDRRNPASPPTGRPCGGRRPAGIPDAPRSAVGKSRTSAVIDRTARPTSGLLEEAGRCRRRQRVAGDVGAERLEPEGEPAALEAGMTGHEDATTAPERRDRGHQTAARVQNRRLARSFGTGRQRRQTSQGGAPLASSASSCCLSLKVSIAFQNPLYS